MNNYGVDRRDFLKTSLAAVSLSMAGGALPLVAGAEQVRRNLKVVCIGAHPDDPESGCAGTLTRYAGLGHLVSVIYLTRGERGIRDTEAAAAAKIRSAEAESACKIMGTKAVFFGQIDADTRVDNGEVEKFVKVLRAENPDIVFTHWPLDSHMDHQVTSLLATRACMQLSPMPQVFYFEVDTGDQSRGFQPNTYVDISEMLERKRAALLAHKSQNGEGIWREHHEIISKWRGREIGVAAAEAFVRLNYGRDLGPAGL